MADFILILKNQNIYGHIKDSDTKKFKTHNLLLWGFNPVAKFLLCG